MHLSTRLDCDLVAVEQTDELTLLVEVCAPDAPSTVDRQPATLEVVLDRSGSMGGARLAGATTALLALVDRLDPTDAFGVVAFNNTTAVVVPAGPLTDKHAVKQALAAVGAGGGTDLSSGYLRGLQEARRVAGPTGATLLLVSDGRANAGITDPDQLGQVAAQAHRNGVSTSTLGFGLGYDERLLGALARGGAGEELFAEDADTAIALISGQVDGLLDQVAQAASLRVTWTKDVAGMDVLNDLPVAALPHGAMVELGSFYAGETRRLLLTLRVPGIAALGLAQVATLELTHVSLPDLVQHTTTLPVQVNVVPGDEAAGRVPDPQVRSEALFQQTQQAKRVSSRLLSEGDISGATTLLRQAGADLRAQLSTLPDAFTAELTSEADLLESLAAQSQVDHLRTAKMSSADSTLKSRQRGRLTRGSLIVLSTRTQPPAELVLEQWELERLRGLLPAELSVLLRGGTGVGEQAACRIAAGLGKQHPHQAFFATSRGFSVGRR